MAKIIRPTYPLNFSIGLLILIFLLSTFLSLEIFAVKWRVVMEGGRPLFGMFLTATAVVIMALILWEEFLFPVRIKPSKDEIIFRNHFTKLKTQVLIYCAIPVIVGFIYFNYEVNYFWFIAWAAVCVISPAGKLISGIKNYNDYLKLTHTTIEYKNNDIEDVLKVPEIQEIILVKDEANNPHKVLVSMQDGSHIVIALDEMELEAYYQTIEDFINSHYRALVR